MKNKLLKSLCIFLIAACVPAAMLATVRYSITGQAGYLLPVPGLSCAALLAMAWLTQYRIPDFPVDGIVGSLVGATLGFYYGGWWP
ncbi:MAG: hypothetical protein KDI44_19270 [Thiothrix sp.]|nr:hypothetical protein [Thiothrix sp.]